MKPKKINKIGILVTGLKFTSKKTVLNVCNSLKIHLENLNCGFVEKDELLRIIKELFLTHDAINSNFNKHNTLTFEQNKKQALRFFNVINFDILYNNEFDSNENYNNNMFVIDFVKDKIHTI